MLASTELEKLRQEFDRKEVTREIQITPFEKRAHFLAERGIPCTPLKIGTKQAFLNGWEESATCNLDQIAKWNKDYPENNVGAVAKAKLGGYWFLELDSVDAAERIERETGKHIPETLKVLSSPGHTHMYFRHSALSLARLTNLAQGFVKHNDWSARVDKMYVVAPFSVHPKTGLRYEVLTDADIVEAPVWLIDWLLSQKTTTATERAAVKPRNEHNLIPHGGIHDHLVSQAGKMRRDGHSVEGIENALVDWAHENCELPLDDNHIRQVARSTAGWEQGNPLASAVNIGGKLAGSAPVATDGKNTSELITRRADTIKMKEVKWLWNHRIPYGKLTVLAGNPDQGKSLVTMYIAAQLSSGRPLYGSSVVIPPCDVLVMAGEDDASDTVIPRLVAAGADLRRIHTVESITTKDGKGATISERELQLDVDIEKIEATLKAKPDIRLVIIDPLSNYLGRANMNREQEVRQVLIPIKLLADRTGVSIVCVMHLNKSSDASAIHRIGGAVAFAGVARACWLFLEDPQDSARHLMLRVKNNLAKSGGGLAYKIEAQSVALGEGKSSMMPFVEWTGETEEKASDLLIAGNPVGRPDKVGSATEWLAKFLSGGSETADDIKAAGKKLGFTDRTVERAIDQAKVELGLVGGWYTHTDSSKKKKRQFVWWLPGHEPKDAISLDNVTVTL
jgi:putative DNA primase/helicase